MAAPSPGEAITKESRTNFYYAFRFLPRPKREAIYAVYAFCRVIDDVVDEAPSAAHVQEELAWWRGELDRCFQGHATHPVTQGLAHHVQRFHIPQVYFEELLNGVEMDVTTHRYATFDELTQYCYRVAAVVGLICIEVFGYAHPGTKQYAMDLGTALQLTNILRDIRVDGERGRIYLPREDLERFRYTEQELLASTYNPAFRELMAFQHARAARYFEAADISRLGQDRPALFPAEIMGTIYQRIHAAIRQVDFNVFAQRVRVPDWEKLAIALRIWLRAAWAMAWS